jgi:hypothetical protein
MHSYINKSYLLYIECLEFDIFYLKANKSTINFINLLGVGPIQKNG